MSPSENHDTLRVITLAEMSPRPPCCQRAHEQGYRRGYRHGYIYALWDVGKVVPLSTELWQQIERFFQETLLPWVWRARQDHTPVSKESGPRMPLQRTRKRRKTA